MFQFQPETGEIKMKYIPSILAGSIVLVSNTVQAQTNPTEFLSKAIVALQAQRNNAMDAQASSDAKLSQALDQLKSANDKIKELEDKIKEMEAQKEKPSEPPK